MASVSSLSGCPPPPLRLTLALLALSCLQLLAAAPDLALFTAHPARLLGETATAPPSSSSSSCPLSDPSLAGFIPLPPGFDYPGYNLDSVLGTDLQTCLRLCLNFPGHKCIMVVTTPASASTSISSAADAVAATSSGVAAGIDCWLKSNATKSPAPNPKVSAYVLPCAWPSTCAKDQTMCRQTFVASSSSSSSSASGAVDSASCECVPPQGMGFVPHPTFTSNFVANNIPSSGYFQGLDPYDCVAQCNVTEECVLVVVSPQTQECFLKYNIALIGDLVLDPTRQAFAVGCALSNGGCDHMACRRGNPVTCIDPMKEYGFQFASDDQDYKGTDLRGFSDIDQATCVQKCQAMPKCTLAQTAPSRQHCWLKTNVPSSGDYQKDRISFRRTDAAKSASGAAPSARAGWQRAAAMLLLLQVLAFCLSL